jgi:hypothetical protein
VHPQRVRMRNLDKTPHFVLYFKPIQLNEIDRSLEVNPTKPQKKKKGKIKKKDLLQPLVMLPIVIMLLTWKELSIKKTLDRI